MSCRNETVVIGHGSSLPNCRIGKYIDSFRYVIRFPHIKGWQNAADYGTKTSYYCAYYTKAKRLLHTLPRPELGYFIWAKFRLRLDRHMKRLIVGYGGRDVTKFIISWSARLPEFAYPRLSQGTAGIIIVAAELKKPITILGCDMLRIGEPDSTKYIRGNGQTFGKVEGWHSFDEERKLIEIASCEYGVDIKFK